MEKLYKRAVDIICCFGLVGLLLTALFVGSVAAQADDTETNVEATLNAVVTLRATVPDTARTAFSLGTEREGSGIIIDDEGLVLTIGYLILEASDVEVSDARGEFVPADVVAYDYDSGFGLVKTRHPLGLKSIALGRSSQLVPGDTAFIIASIGPDYIQPVEVVDVREFAGYWEYLLDEAIFTAPSFDGFGGAALLSDEGRLVGVGSLIVHDAGPGQHPLPGNMFVPIDLLKPIFSDLIEHGRSTEDARPWLGVYTGMDRGHLFVFRVAPDSPAESGGMLRNDIIIAINDQPVAGMADFLRKLWAIGSAGVRVEISVLRDGQVTELEIETGDRYDWLELDTVSRFAI